MSTVTHLRSITVSCREPRSLLGFYVDTWGLELVAEEVDGSFSLRGRGAEHHVFTIAGGDDHALERICLGAPDRVAVDFAAERAHKLGYSVEREPGPRNATGGGYAAVVRDPEGRRYEISSDIETHTTSPAATTGPDRLSHIVLNATDMVASQDFLVDLLGFRISDRYEDDQMVFLRCNKLHHCIVLAPGPWTSLNHVAFEVDSADEVMRALGRMRAAGLETVWGPGRHGPGGNVFCYFTDPVGNVIEYTAELLAVDEDWEAQSWVRNQANADVWGTSGGLTPQVIAAMTNPPASERTSPSGTTK